MGEILRAMARRNTRRWATGLALAGVLATGPGLAAAEGFRGEWGGGPTVRMVETHFIDSTSFPTETWTNYSFFGVRGEGRWGGEILRNFWVDGGIGVAALAGDYDYEIGASSGSGGAAAAVEFDVSAQTGFPIAPASVPLVGLARVGLSTLLLFADAASDGTVPWDEAFDEGLTELYMSAGIGYRFMDHLMGSLMYRFTAAQLDAWTDLRDNAEWEDFSNAGPELRVSFIY